MPSPPPGVTLDLAGFTGRRPTALFHDGSMLVMVPMVLFGLAGLAGLLLGGVRLELEYALFLVGLLGYTIAMAWATWDMFRHFLAQWTLRVTAEEAVVTRRWFGSEERRFALSELVVTSAVEEGPDQADWRVLGLKDGEGTIRFPIGRVVDGADYEDLARWTHHAVQDAKATLQNQQKGGDLEELQSKMAHLRQPQ